MNLFGLEITLAKDTKDEGNGKYVKKEECHYAHEKLEHFLDVRFSDLSKRIDDIKDFLMGLNERRTP